MAGIETTEEATWLTPFGCHSLLSVAGDLLAPAKSRADIVVAVVVIRGGCGHAIIKIEVVERIVSLAFRNVRSTSLGKGPHRDSQVIAIVAVKQPFIPFADRVGFEAFIAIARPDRNFIPFNLPFVKLSFKLI